MKPNGVKLNRKRFFLHTILPVVLAVGSFVVLIFAFIVPYVEYHLINGKKEVLRELVNSAVSLAERYERDVQEGLIMREEAQIRAIRRIGYIRYGIENKDYFWITDTVPRMINHPYRGDLNGQDLTDFADPSGKKLFIECVRVTAENGEGYVNYEWQWMDDSLHIVPKISFVKVFKPWGWIIGTGIYIEDVRAEIAGIKQMMVITLLGICLFIALLILYIVRQQLTAEMKRLEAERLLIVSREKYKSLVEASTDGSLLITDNRCIYMNPVIRSRLDFPENMTVSNDFHELIPSHRRPDMERIEQWIGSDSLNMNIETQLVDPAGTLIDAVLSLSKASLSGQPGLIVSVKDITETKFEIEPSDRDRWIRLSESFGIGFFRSQPGRKGKIISANQTTVRMLGFNTEEELFRHTILDLIIDPDDRKRLMRSLEELDFIKDFRIRMLTYDSRIRRFAVTAVTHRKEDQKIAHVDGILRDVTGESDAADQQDELITRLQIPWNIWNHPVWQFADKPVFCSYLLKLSEAAAYMSAMKAEVMLVNGSNSEPIGAIISNTFRDALSRRFIDPEQPVFEIMRAPVVITTPDASLFSAVTQMDRLGSDYAAVRNLEGRITGVITRNGLSDLLNASFRYLYGNTADWPNLKAIEEQRRQLEYLIASMMGGSAKIHDITRMYSSFADRAASRIAEWIIAEMGKPPVPFAFIALGSEGRSEQTLMTDQDNALIYKPDESGDPDFIRKYFINFGTRMNRMLDEAGYHLCKGDIMAGNPKWCQPIDEWKAYFSKWIRTPEPQAILDTSVFFDLRGVYGDLRLVGELKNSVNQTLEQNPSFFNHLAMACINYKMPIGMFNKIQTETGSEKVNLFNIKSPIRVIVHMIRLYAMFHRIPETNTLLRLRRLHEKNFFSRSAYREMKEAFEFLMSLQLRSQSESIRSYQQATPYINLPDLTSIETDTLVSIFNRIVIFQSSLSRDFSVS